MTVRDNSATVGGGGIASYSQLSMVNSTVSGNGSEQSGGGIYLPGGSTGTVASSTIADNTADSNADGNGDGGGFVGGATTSVNFHNVINASRETPLKLYTLYSPPQHPAGTVHRTRQEAMVAEHH